MKFVAQQILTGIGRVLTGARAHWLGCTPEPGTQRVYFANHSSHLDGLIMWCAMPRRIRGRTRPVAAKDYWSSPFKRYLAEHVINALLINRTRANPDDDDPIAEMIGALDQGDSLIIFPEGTRGPGGDPMPFKSGLYRIASARPKVDLVPVWLENMNRILPKGQVLPVPMLGSVWIGAPLHLAPGEDKDVFLARARDAVLALRRPARPEDEEDRRALPAEAAVEAEGQR